MAVQLSKAELVALVQRLMAADGSETELDEMLALFSANVPHPAASDLVFYPSEEALSAGQIVEQALAYRAVSVGNVADA